jgi:hypothetical protein
MVRLYSTLYVLHQKTAVQCTYSTVYTYELYSTLYTVQSRTIIHPSLKDDSIDISDHRVLCHRCHQCIVQYIRDRDFIEIWYVANISN